MNVRPAYCLSFFLVLVYRLVAAETDLQPKPGLRTRTELTLLSANDGFMHLKIDKPSYPAFRLDVTNITRDSITVVHLGPNHPPTKKTVYGTVPNTIIGAPYLATSRDGRLGFVPCHKGAAFAPKPGNILSVIDLASTNLDVIQRINIAFPNLAVAHPNGTNLVVSCATGFQVFDIRNDRLALRKDNQLGVVPDSFDISPDGKRIVATLTKAPDTHEITGVRVFSFEDGTIRDEGEVKVRPGLPAFDQPFSLRWAPDGRRVVVPNGGGISAKGKLDDVLIIDMTLSPPLVTEAIAQVADGIESLAIHPDGKFAVLSCLDDAPGDVTTGFSHLAVVDLTSHPPQLLYELPVESFPEGIAFTPDGTQLFVQLTTAHRIVVFDVAGFALNRSPFVIRVGHGPSAMGISRRF